MTWKKVENGLGGGEEVPYPRSGLDATFDEANKVVEDLKDKIHKYIDKIRDIFRERHKGDAKKLKLAN